MWATASIDGGDTRRFGPAGIGPPGAAMLWLLAAGCTRPNPAYEMSADAGVDDASVGRSTSSGGRRRPTVLRRCERRPCRARRHHVAGDAAAPADAAARHVAGRGFAARSACRHGIAGRRRVARSAAQTSPRPRVPRRMTRTETASETRATTAPPTSTLTRPTSWRRTPAWPPMGWAMSATRAPPRAATPCCSSTDFRAPPWTPPGRTTAPSFPSPAATSSSTDPGDTTARSLQRGMGTDVLVNTRFAFTAWGVDGDANLNQNLFIGVRGNSSNGEDVRCSARRASTGTNATSVAYFDYGRRRLAARHGRHPTRPRDDLPVDHDGARPADRMQHRSRQDQLRAACPPQRLPSDPRSQHRSPRPEHRRVPARLALISTSAGKELAAAGL